MRSCMQRLLSRAKTSQFDVQMSLPLEIPTVRKVRALRMWAGELGKWPSSAGQP